MSIIQRLMAHLPKARQAQQEQLTQPLQQVQELQAELAALRTACGIAPPGHFYSPVPDFAQVLAEAARVLPPRNALSSKVLPGIELNETEQLALLHSFAALYPSLPFTPEKTAGLRYHYDNGNYSYSDAIMLACMIRHAGTRRLIEVGSGFSSCVTLDVNERFMTSAMDITFIEPYPTLLHSLMREGDAARCKVIGERAQDVDTSVFAALDKGDILFIDSTHVSKIDSDVNHLLFRILPTLRPGVLVHVHDIFFPFEYPQIWVEEGRAWNEAYVLRAFLQYNAKFKVVLMNTFMAQFHEAFFAQHMPLCLRNTGGSIWLEVQ